MAFVKSGSGAIKVNGAPISLVQPEILKLKVYEPVLLLGPDRFKDVRLFNSIYPDSNSNVILPKVDIRVRVKGGGTTAQIYAIRQAIAKGIVAYYQKCE